MISSIHVLGSRQLGGADRFFIRLVEALTRAGHPTLAVTRPGSPVAQALGRDVEQVHLPLAAKWDMYSRWRLTRLIRERRSDVVQTYMGRATRLTRLPADSSSVHLARLGGYYKIAGYYDHADAWIGNTGGVCRHLLKHGLPEDRVFQIGNFVPTPRPVAAGEIAKLREQLNLSEQARIVFALGRLVDKKGFDDLLMAFAQSPAEIEGRPIALVIAGDGPARKRLESLGRQLGLGARLRWAGWQNDPTPYYALADWFVCPSRHEPLGNVILEAWQNGLPVLSTRNEGALELVHEGRDALLAPLKDAAALGNVLRAALELPESERKRLAAAGFGTVQREHSEAAVLDAYLSLYAQLRSDRQRSRTPARQVLPATH